MSASAESSPTALKRLVDGYRVSQAISATVLLGVPDLLGDGSSTSAELAAATGADEATLYRVLRALASAGVLKEEAGRRRFALTELGMPLRTDSPDSLAGWAAFIGRPHEWQAWSGLADAVRTGENAFTSVHGMDVWTHRAQSPEEGAYFDRAMQSRLRLMTASLLTYDFGRFRRIVDLGGGNGSLLAAILSTHDEVEGVLFDQEHVVAGAPAVLDAAGVAERCEIVAGSFFESVPDDGDAYVMSAILHDWEDEDARRILETVRRAIPADGTLLVLERLVGGPNEDLETKFGDLTMLVIPGGRERTRDEFAELFSSSGFRLRDAIPAGSHFVIEGEPA